MCYLVGRDSEFGGADGWEASFWVPEDDGGAESEFGEIRSRAFLAASNSERSATRIAPTTTTIAMSRLFFRASIMRSESGLEPASGVFFRNFSNSSSLARNPRRVWSIAAFAFDSYRGSLKSGVPLTMEISRNTSRIA